MKRAVDRDFSGIVPEYDTLTWETARRLWADVPQVTGGAIRAARGFVVGPKIFFAEYPKSNHEVFWNEDVKPHVSVDSWEDRDKNDRQVLFFRLGPSPSFIMHNPFLDEVEQETMLRGAQLMKKMQVPRDADVVWNSGLVTDNANAGEYYELIE